MATKGTGTIVRKQYSGAAVAYSTWLDTDGFDLGLGMTEPLLERPIDYDAAIAERRRTHEPLDEYDGDSGNTAFGI